MKFTWEDCMSKSKGFMGLILLVGIWAGIFLSLYIVKTIHINDILKIGRDLDIFLEVNDKGTELVSFLQSKKDLMSYMGVLGSSSANNFPEDFDKDITSTLEKIKKSMKYDGYILAISNSSGNVIKEYPEKTLTSTTSTPATIGGLSLGWPVDDHTINSGFGWRTATEFHGGIDFPVPEGTPVKAAADGKVDHAGWQNPNNHKEGMGLYVRIQHHGNYYTYYGHLSKVDVIVGQKVSKGDKIGESGKTGYVTGSTGEHLHFELRDSAANEDVDSVNVCQYLGCPKGCQQDCPYYDNKQSCGQACHFAGIPGEPGEPGVGGLRNAQSMSIPMPGCQKGFAELVTW